MIRMMDRALWMAPVLTLTIACVLQLFMPPLAQAQDVDINSPVIFDVRRNLPLEPGEPTYRDFYISVGPEGGIKKGMYVTVVRQLPVHNPIVNKQQAMIDITVGKLRVIHVERGISVARLDSELTNDERPTLEFEGIMIGDRIDLRASSMEAPGGSKSKAKARIERQEAGEVVAASANASSSANAATVSAAASASSALNSAVAVGANLAPQGAGGSVAPAAAQGVAPGANSPSNPASAPGAAPASAPISAPHSAPVAIPVPAPAARQGGSAGFLSPGPSGSGPSASLEGAVGPSAAAENTFPPVT